MGKLTLAGTVVILALGWQYATVNLNYGGNWTALYCTGDKHATPPELAAEKIYTFPGSYGFDGQFYHYIAHQPWPGRFYPYVEGPGMRYRRILLPALAWALSSGNAGLIDFCYRLAGLVFIFLGVWWLASLAERAGASRVWGAAFVLLPASLVFVDRLTVDHVLAALVAGFALHATRPPSRRFYAILLLAPLAREIGLILTAAWCLSCAVRRQWKLAILYATSAIPFLLWAFYLSSRTIAGTYQTTFVPLAGWFHWLIHPVAYPQGIPLAGVVRAADIVALLGMALAIVLAVVLFVKRRFDPVSLAAVLFAGLAVFVQRGDVWLTVYNYGRIFSPLLLLVFLGWFPTRRWLGALPIALLLPRLVIQFGRQAQGILAAITG